MPVRVMKTARAEAEKLMTQFGSALLVVSTCLLAIELPTMWRVMVLSFYEVLGRLRISEFPTSDPFSDHFDPEYSWYSLFRFVAIYIALATSTLNAIHFVKHIFKEKKVANTRFQKKR